MTNKLTITPPEFNPIEVRYHEKWKDSSNEFRSHTYLTFSVVGSEVNSRVNYRLNKTLACFKSYRLNTPYLLQTNGNKFGSVVVVCDLFRMYFMIQPNKIFYVCPHNIDSLTHVNPALFMNELDLAQYKDALIPFIESYRVLCVDLIKKYGVESIDVLHPYKEGLHYAITERDKAKVDSGKYYLLDKSVKQIETRNTEELKALGIDLVSA